MSNQSFETLEVGITLHCSLRIALPVDVWNGNEIDQIIREQIADYYKCPDTSAKIDYGMPLDTLIAMHAETTGISYVDFLKTLKLQATLQNFQIIEDNARLRIELDDVNLKLATIRKILCEFINKQL